MNNSFGSYSFLPWLRRGISTEIERVDGSGAAAPRAEVPVTLMIRAGSEDRPASVKLGLYGPGEVSGIDARMIIRTFPRADVFDAESNYFPLAEFHQPDFPWRYTPASASGERLRPWIVLIVLAEDEIESLQPAGADGRLPLVTVKSAASLPLLDQSWAWAHVQISSLGTSPVPDLLQQDPGRMLSRLLCPRHLQPRTAYQAYLVPAFERGRRAGLREEMDETLDGLIPAWQPADHSVRLPVYYQWRFQTGTAGDFEYLVRQLRGRPAPEELGQRPMDVQNPSPAFSLPPASDQLMGMEGALRAPTSESTPWDAASRAAFVQALAGLLNRPADLLQDSSAGTVVAPPLYGRWAAMHDRLEPGSPPPWFQELNADPRQRASAGLGTQVIQTQQESLMASAWEQVEGVLALNEKLRQAQLAREVAERMRKRHLISLDADTALLVTAPWHAHVTAVSIQSGGTLTLQAMFKESPVVEGALEGQFRRVARPRGPISRRAGRPWVENPRPADLLARMNRGELNPAPPPPAPRRMTSPAGSGLGGEATPESVQRMRKGADLLSVLGGLLALLGLFLLLARRIRGGLAFGLTLGGAASFLLGRRQRRRADRLGLRVALRDGSAGREQVLQAPLSPRFTPAPTPADGHTPRPDGVFDSQTQQQQAVEAMRLAFSDALAEMDAPLPPGPTLTPARLPALREKILQAVDPRKTLADAFRARLKVASWVHWQPKDPLEPVMAAPQFPQPMYEPLRDLSQEWLLPGVGLIPPDTVTLLMTNQAFVESYMVGLNHEMARELLWREYPTDQRGSYFRQFWDVRGAVPPPGQTLDPEKLKDIKRLHTWGDQAGLGDNSARTPPPGGEHLVLLVRGEVLRRYPNIVVYAVKAVPGPEGLRILGDEQRFPVFQGSLKPDIAFYGFELTPGQARGDTAPAADQGWFFMLQEQPGEPRFGLDLPEAVQPGSAPTRWDDLSWGSLAASPAELDGLVYIDLNASLPDTRLIPPQGTPPIAWHAEQGQGPSGSRASDLASITLQKPFRVAIHASDLLL